MATATQGTQVDIPVRAVRRAGADAPAQPVVFRKLFTVSTRARGAAVSEPAHGLVHRSEKDSERNGEWTPSLCASEGHIKPSGPGRRVLVSDQGHQQPRPAMGGWRPRGLASQSEIKSHIQKIPFQNCIEKWVPSLAFVDADATARTKAVAACPRSPSPDLNARCSSLPAFTDYACFYAAAAKPKGTPGKARLSSALDDNRPKSLPRRTTADADGDVTERRYCCRVERDDFR
ncbi:hypothetical protein EVAR_81370_1 [Eumeta japonica]|uniref:Uncharacterized protein n=1 Tax=Eumeta variegata TaxID=151549 RepID=A0A4C1WF39_EUMVA|nr:hypothetical protein EVAR_81370_1 [Eumeta japonica]